MKRSAVAARERRAQALGSRELDLHDGVVVQVPADAGECVDGLDPGGPQLVRVADAGAEQDRRRAVGAGSQHGRAGANAELLPAAPRDHLHPVVPVDDAVAESLVDDPQTRAVTRRVEVRERGVDANAAAPR